MLRPFKTDRRLFICSVIIVTVLTFIAVNRTAHNQLGFDFRAYYEAAQRLLEGEPVYTRVTESFLFKYAPVSVLCFVPFTVFPFGVALWLYAALCLFAVVATPVWLLRILSRPGVLDIRPRQIQIALTVSLFGSLRLIDSEFQVSQIGSLLFFLMVVGLDRLMIAKSPTQIFGGWFLGGLGGIMKVHPLAAYSLFLPELKTKRFRYALLALVLLLMLPYPWLWKHWFEQMRVTTDWIPMGEASTNLQGLQPFAIRYFGFARHGAAMYALTLILFSALWACLPHFDLDRARAKPQAMVYAFGALVLFGVIVSPLPWQYTYVPFWGLCFASWLGADSREKIALLLISFFLAISPKGIVGLEVSMFLEHRQLVAVAFAAFVVVLTCQARRHARN